MDDFMNERTLIYTKFDHDEVIIFGILYEFYNMLLEKDTIGLEGSYLAKLVKILFKEYVDKYDKDNINYIEFYDGFLDLYLSKLHIDESIMHSKGISIKKIIGIDIKDFRNSIKQIDTYYPYINIINNLDISYQNKTNLIIYINNHLSSVYNVLNSFYDIDTTIKIHELIEDNTLSYLNNVDTNNFNINDFKKQFELENKKYIDSLITNNIFNPSNINIEDKELNELHKKLNKKERKVLTYLLKLSLSTESIESLFENKEALLKEIDMSNFSFEYNTLKLIKKFNKSLRK